MTFSFEELFKHIRAASQSLKVVWNLSRDLTACVRDALPSKLHKSTDERKDKRPGD